MQALEQIVNPTELIHLLGEELRTGANGEYTTVCPKCESKLYILDKEFVCENNLCTFRAGSPIDYLVAKGVCPWEQTIDTLNRILDGRIKGTVLYNNQKSITQQLKSKRRIFDFFLRNAINGTADNMKIIQFRNALRSQGLDPEVLRHSIFVISADEAEKLSDNIRALHPDKHGAIRGANIILPYFSNYHTVSHLLVLKTPDARPEKVNIIPARTAFFALLQRHPACKNNTLAFTYAATAKTNTQYSRINPEAICLHMMVDATADGVSFVLPQADYLACGENNTDLRIASTIQRYVPNFKVVENKLGLRTDHISVDADEFILKCVVKELKNNIPISSILPLVDLTPKSRQALLEKLHANRYFDAADEVRNFFKTLPVYKDDKVTLFSNPYGYSLKKHNNDSYTTCLSNFTVDLEHNIVFTESTDIFHSGMVQFNNDRYPIVLKHDELDRIAELEKAARRATIGAPTDELNIPTIKERSGAKYLINYLREQVSQLPKTEGIPLLGWSARRTSFYAPYFITDRKGSRTGKKYLHPSITTLSNYTTDISDSGSLYHELPDVVVNILNQVASFITRSFLSMQIRPLPIYNNAEARRLFSDMFSAVGQTALLQLNHNMRGEEMPGLRGFPFYAVGYTSSQISKSSLPAFILCDAGLTINENLSPEIVRKAQSSLKFIIQAVAEWAVKTDAANFQQAHSVSRANAYSIEGARIIIDACNLTEWPSSKTPFENLDSLLSAISFEDVKNYFIRDINQHKLLIKHEALRHVRDMRGLERELKIIAKSVNVAAGEIDVDSESMMEALNSFYHMQPVVTDNFNSEELMRRLKL